MIHIFLRHCDFSEISKHKSRPSWFSREICFKNLLSCINSNPNVKLHIIYDGINPQIKYPQYIPVHKIKAGSEAESFKYILAFLDNYKCDKEDILYCLEDDYIHNPYEDIFNVISQTMSVLEENSYLSLYDHPDKYSDLYPNLKSEIKLINGRYWRTTPSTTNTFICKYKTLMEDLIDHFNFSNFPITRDHEKFLHLATKGRKLYTPLPGLSTHVETNMLSPGTNWQRISNIYL